MSPSCGTCQECGGTYTLTQKGLIRSHYLPVRPNENFRQARRAGRLMLCLGSGQPPKR